MYKNYLNKKMITIIHSTQKKRMNKLLTHAFLGYIKIILCFTFEFIQTIQFIIYVTRYITF